MTNQRSSFAVTLIFTMTLLLNQTATAASPSTEESGSTPLEIKDSTFLCDGSRLNLKSPTLEAISEGRITSAQVNLNTEYECNQNLQLLNDALRNKETIYVKYKTNIRIESYYLDYSEGCFQNTCSVDVDDHEMTEIVIQILGYNFLGNSWRSLGIKTVTWPQDSCPPWSPDCDL